MPLPISSWPLAAVEPLTPVPPTATPRVPDVIALALRAIGVLEALVSWPWALTVKVPVELALP